MTAVVERGEIVPNGFHPLRAPEILREPLDIVAQLALGREHVVLEERGVPCRGILPSSQARPARCEMSHEWTASRSQPTHERASRQLVCTAVVSRQSSAVSRQSDEDDVVVLLRLVRARAATARRARFLGVGGAAGRRARRLAGACAAVRALRERQEGRALRADGARRGHPRVEVVARAQQEADRERRVDLDQRHLAQRGAVAAAHV
eukprot:CAMPEP_0119409158 /NCGR_PEP_ID=MMETSP1335-20130426/2512_1 /TAXON_ID=259385 /ORGANISM="Chrysoculter rhomboideus, Strain RCC1486" /LENGTH=206 /DNA_ID=CAMNT_0007433493 /DNA_START=260 /DNA_END=877 /DNA_ORIENTATION=-